MRRPVTPPRREHRAARLVTALAVVFAAVWFALEASGDSSLLLAGGGAWAASILADGRRG